MGRAADTSNRKNIITAGCLIWNVALMGMGMSSDFVELLVLRLTLGFGQVMNAWHAWEASAALDPPMTLRGTVQRVQLFWRIDPHCQHHASPPVRYERFRPPIVLACTRAHSRTLVPDPSQAFSNPASYSMIADLFPPEMRPTANGQFASGMYIGGGLASVSMDIATGIGWRSTCFVCSIFGGACAVLLFVSMKEPTRMNQAVKKASGEVPPPPNRFYALARASLFLHQPGAAHSPSPTPSLHAFP